MKRADASGARYAAIVGDDEAASSLVTLKPLRASGEQMKVPLDEALERLRPRN
jgi:histidyl-tRNA synthetase